MTDLTQTQQDLLKKMQAGDLLKLSKHSDDFLIVGRFSSKVLRSTVQALERAGRVRDAKRLDDKGNKLFELAPARLPGVRPSGWPFPVSAHAGWR